MGRTLLAIGCGGAVVAALYGPVLAAQGRGSREAQPRELERSSRVELDGFGASLGVNVRDVTADEAQKARLSPTQGAYVSRVEAGTPAEKAGVAAGDIIVEFDGERVRSARQLSRLVRESPDDRPVRMAVVRDGNRRTLDVTPQRDRPYVALPDLGRLDREMRDLAQRFEFNYNGPNGNAWGGWVAGRARLGLQLMPMNDQLAAYFGVKGGVLVTSVEMDSPAGRAGVKAGDVITSVNGRTLDEVSELLDEVRRADAGASIAITLMRDHKELKLTARLPEDDRPRRIERRGRSI